MKTDSWKRPVEQKRKIDPEYSQQLELVFKPEDATTEHINHWQETELNWWAERPLGFVAMALIPINSIRFYDVVLFNRHSIFLSNK